ncbi:MAG: hypothetical protein IIB81_00110 [Nanoarchaeota archaeon]|nr:hypothetical protein [Nanoarchaeota archaeon]
MTEHRIVAEYKTASNISQEYLNILKAEILNKGLVGKKADKKTIDDIVSFLHSDKVAGMIRKGLESKLGSGVTNDELLERYGLPKHAIQEAFKGYDSVTEDMLINLVSQLSTQLHGELTSNHPTALANLAYSKGPEAAQKVIKRLYHVSGGEGYEADNKKTIESLVEPGKILEHMTGLYQRRDLHNELQRHKVKSMKPVYN